MVVCIHQLALVQRQERRARPGRRPCGLEHFAGLARAALRRRCLQAGGRPAKVQITAQRVTRAVVGLEVDHQSVRRLSARLLIDPDVIHHHLVGEITGRHRPAQRPANREIQDDIHRIVEWPGGGVGVGGLGVFKVSVVDVAIYPDTYGGRCPPELIGVELFDAAAETRLLLELRVAVGARGLVVVAAKVQGGLNLRFIKVERGPFGDINLARVWPGALTEQPDGGPGAGLGR